MVAKTACQSCAALVPDIFNRLLDSLHQASELQAQSGNTSASRQILSIYSLVYENKLDLQQKLNQRFEANLTQALDNFLQKREQMKSGLMTDSAEWTLMEADEVDKLIIIKNLTHKLIVNHEASLFEVGSRLATLAVVAGVPVSINPLRPDILVDAIYEMWESSHASRDPGLSLLFSISLTEEVVGDLRPMYLSVVEVFTNLKIQPTKPTLLDRQSSGSPYSSTSGGATGFQQSGSQNPLTGATLGGNAGQTTDSSAAPLPISFFNRLQKLAGGLLPANSDASSDLLSGAGLDPGNISALGSGAADASGSNNALTLQLLSQLVSRLPPPAASASAPVALRPMANEAMSALVPLNAKSDVLNALGYLQSAQLQQPEQFRQALSPDPAQLTQTEGDVT
ncbi:MAG: DUF1631 domain-containing protein, partial [Burkholderiales bacterium]|nr:DUF1631 domain-containing protein [Burkholderiales bacterium]